MEHSIETNLESFSGAKEIKLSNMLKKEKSNKYNPGNRNFKYKIKDGPTFSLLNFMSKYREQLLDYTEEEELDKQFHFKPETYCWYKYKMPDLSDLILMINNCFHPSDFKMVSVKYFTKEGIYVITQLINDNRKLFELNEGKTAELVDEPLFRI